MFVLLEIQKRKEVLIERMVVRQKIGAELGGLPVVRMAGVQLELSWFLWWGW